MLRRLLLLAALFAPVCARAADIQWNGPDGGYASDNNNWVGNVRPANGDSAIFDNTAQTSSCQWDYAVSLTSITFSDGYNAMVQVSSHLAVGRIDMGGALGSSLGVVAGSGAASITVSSDLFVGAGTFFVNHATATVKGRFVMTAGTLYLGGGRIYASSMTIGAELQSEDTGDGVVPLLASTSTATHLSFSIDGAVSVSTLALRGLDANGFLVAGATINQLDGLIFMSGQPSGSTALNLAGGGVLVSTFSRFQFDDPNIAVNVEAASLASNSRVSMRSHSGVRAGDAYEDDPSNVVDWGPFTGSSITAAGFFGVTATGLGTGWNSGYSQGTTYYALVSTMTSGAPVAASSTTRNSFASFTGLSVNTTYYARVSTAASGGISYAIGRQATNPNDITGLALTQVWETSATLTWSANGNPSDTFYQTGDFGGNSQNPVINGSVMQGTTQDIASLLANTTYVLQARVVGHNGAYGTTLSVTTTTLARDPIPLAVTLATTGSFKASWSSNFNSTLTVYELIGSTDSFATTSFKVFSTTDYALLQGLVPNATYYLKVRANGLRKTTPYAQFADAFTNPSDPVAGTITQTLDTVAATWTSNNFKNTIYEAQLSTVATFTPLLASSVTLNASASFTGLVSDTTHYVRVKAWGWGGTDSGFSTTLTTATFPDVPGASAPSGLSASGFTANWTRGANNAASPTNYRVQLSTDNFATLNGAVVTTGLSNAFSGLQANTTYYARVRAEGYAGATAYTVLTATRTLLLPPASPSVSAKTTTSLTFAWTSGGNGAATLYEAQLSTDSFATLNASSITANLFASFASLTANTTYYGRVRAGSSDGASLSAFVSIGSTATTPATPASASAAVYFTSATLSWSANGNPAGTVYLAEAVDQGSSVAASSVTRNASAALTGLTADTTYTLRVQALGSDSTVTPYASLTTATYAAAPVSAAPSGVLGSVLSANWLANGNPAGAVYEARISTDNFATVNRSSVTMNVSAQFTGLTLNTTYYTQVRALGKNGAATAYTVLPTTVTLVVAHMGISATASTPTSLTVAAMSANPAGTWNSIELSTDNFATVTAASFTANTSALFSGLLTDTSYYMRSRAFNWGGTATAYTSIASTQTPAAAPASAQPSGVTASALTANWSANGNPATTRFTAQISTDAFATINASSATFNVFASFSGLQANTSYDLRVRADGLSGPTAFTALPSTRTQLLLPGSAGAPFSGRTQSTLTFSWTSGGNGASTVYVADLSTDSFATLNASSSTANVFASFTGLTANTTYYARVRATDGGSLTSGFVTLGSTATQAFAPSGAALGTVATTSAALTWSANGNPSGTIYLAEAVDAGSAVAASSRTLSVAATLPGLTPDTTYTLRVKVLAHDGTSTSYATAATTATYAGAPGSAAESGLSASAFTSNWLASGNPAGTTYQAQLSTDAFATLNVSSVTANVSAPWSGLLGNTTYYARVRALGRNGAATAYTSLPTVATLPAAPSSPSVAASAGATSLSLSWSAANPTGTQYGAEVSTDGFATVNASSLTANLSASFSGLQSNTTHYLRARAFSWGGSPTAYSTIVTTATAAAAPASAATTGLSTGSVTANWAANGNAALTTLYEAQVSDDNFASVLASSFTYGLSAPFTGLSGNTTYYLRARAYGRGGGATAFTALPTAQTLLETPGAGAPSLVSIGYTTATIQWTSGGNGAGTIYDAELSTDSFATVSKTSSTLNLAATFSSLVPDTTYYARVRSRSGGNASAYLSLGAEPTLAYPPAGTALLSVSSTAVTIDWSANGNPDPGSWWEAQADVAASFASAVTQTVSSSAATFSGLASGTTYYFRVRGVGHGGDLTSYDATISTTTRPLAPAAPGTPAGTATSTGTISWTWAGSALASSYRVYSASNTAALMASPATNAFVETGLTRNTAYGLRASGFNATGEGPLSAAATVYTLATPPTGSAASNVFATSATISWALNGNPAGTTAQVQRSSDNVTFASVTTSAGLYIDTSLLGCSSYYYKIRFQNGDGIPTAFDSTINFTTLGTTPTPPIGLTADSVSGGRVALSWSPSATEGITQYRLFSDGGTGAVNYAAPVAVLTSTETSFTTGVLASSASYTFALRARHRCGVEETTGVFAAAASTAALSSVRAAIKTPDSGKRIKGNSVTIVADLTSGTPSQVSQVRFQYRVQGTSTWSDIAAANVAHPNPDPDAPYFVQADADAQGPGTYELRAVAYDLSNVPDSSPAITVVTIVTGATFDISESVRGDGKIQKDQVVTNTVASTLRTGGVNAGDPEILITLPAGALSSTATVSIISNPVIPATATPSGFTLVGSALQIDLSNGQTVLNAPANLTLSYPSSADGAGQLQIQSYDPGTGLWSAIGSPTVDTVLRRVTAATPHFSTFAIIAGGGAPQANLDSVRVYPNPFKPNGSDPNEGKTYTASDDTSGIIFDRLPATVSLKIYTLSGRLVAQYDVTNGTGALRWDAKNTDGRDVASGGYFAVIRSPGAKPIVKKLLIIR